MTEGIIKLGGYCAVLVIGLLIGYNINKNNDSFTDNSQKYLNDYKIDLPEEITQMDTLSDDSLARTNLYGVIDPVNKVIHIAFDHVDYSNQFKEYQLDVDMKGFHLYDGPRYVGFGKWDDKSALDSLMLIDNQ
jgi:hypothetical protein